MVACAPEPDATLVAMPGCGLEDLELNALRVVPRGDFPSTEVPGLLLSGEDSVFEDLPDDVDAITVEGRFNEITEAVGRTARLDVDGDVPVYFAPPDQLCAVNSGVSFLSVGGMGVGPLGDVLMAGGRTVDGQLSDALVHFRDIDGVATPLDVRLPDPSTALSVHSVGDRELVIVGGATDEPTALASVVLVDLSQGPQRAKVSEPIPISVPKRPEPGRAHHAAARLPGGRVMVIGGCSVTDAGACDPMAGSVLDTGFAVVPTGDGVRFEPVAPLSEPRYDHDLLVARDGVAFAVGGRGVGGEPVRVLERLRPGHRAWESYGPPLSDELPPDVAIVGSALLEGGLLVLALSDDTMAWVSETGTDVLREWCVADVPCFASAGSMLEVSRRSLVALPGERIVADAFLLPVALAGLTGTDALDLSAPRPGVFVPPPGQRIAAAVVQLDDGTVLFAGGRDPQTGDPEQPFLLRLRPALDGPDESIPDVAGLDAGAFVLHDVPTPAVLPTQPKTPRISLDDDALEIRSAFLPEPFPVVWAHVRGFRSASFRLELTLEASGALPHVVLTQGAVAGASIRFDGAQGGASSRVHGARRDAQGRTIEFTCGLHSPDFDDAGALRIDVRPQGIEIRADGDIVGQCPGLGHTPLAVGIGASGSGNLRIHDIRLTRI